MDTTTSILKKLHAFYKADPKRHIKHQLMRDINGNECFEPEKTVACCLVGGIEKFTPHELGCWGRVYDCIEQAIEELYPNNEYVRSEGLVVVGFNNHPDTKADDVIKVLARACEIAADKDKRAA